MMLLILGLLLAQTTIGQVCTSNTQCPINAPYCRLDKKTCVPCLSNIHCRNITNCNAVCDNNHCNNVNPNSICDSVNDICYQGVGRCLPKCNQDSDCAKYPQVLHYPNVGVCDLPTGRCYDCLTTVDCKPYKNETCGASCAWNIETLEFLCGNGQLCKSGKSCLSVITSPNVYSCSDASVFTLSISLIVLVAFFYKLNFKNFN